MSRSRGEGRRKLECRSTYARLRHDNRLVQPMLARWPRSLVGCPRMYPLRVPAAARCQPTKEAYAAAGHLRHLSRGTIRPWKSAGARLSCLKGLWQIPDTRCNTSLNNESLCFSINRAILLGDGSGSFLSAPHRQHLCRVDAGASWRPCRPFSKFSCS